MALQFFQPRMRAAVALAMALMASLTAGCKQKPWTLWESYQARFVDGQGRVIDPMGSKTTSEGQSYALFFALVNNDRQSFDRLLTWTQANLAAGDMSTHLPGWLWGRAQDGSWHLLDQNSASDADLWIAYSLIEAGRLWNDPVYTHLGRRMMTMIAQREVANLPGFGYMLLPGPVGYEHQRSATLKTWMLNPSYLPLFLFDRLAAVDPGGPWHQIARNVPKLLGQSAVHGYAMDWVEYVPGDGFYPAVLPSGGNSSAPVGSYDAIRVYLWAGMIDAGEPGQKALLGAIPGLAGYLADHDAPPEKVSDLGIPGAQAAPVGFSAAVLPYLRAMGQLDKAATRQLLRLSAQRDGATNLYGKDPAYFDQNLALFATGFTDGRFRFGAGGELKVEWAKG